MKSIRILDQNINLLGEIDNYQEFKLNRRFYRLSEFEFKINANSIHSDKLVKNNLVLLGRDYKNVGIILHREFDGNDKSDLLLIRGVTLKGLLSRRLIVPDTGESYESCKGKQETIIKYFVNKNCVNPINGKRKIDRLIISEDKQRGLEDAWRSSYDVLSDKTKEIGEHSNLGWNIVLDKETKQFIFDVIEGKDLTVNQNLNPPVIFRSDFKNIDKRHFINSIINSKNIVYVGTKEDGTKLVLSVGEDEGFERIETFVTINSSDVEEIKKEGNLKLKDFEELKSFEFEVNPNDTFIYGYDYDLGDIVTVQDRKLNITMNARIVEIQEYHDKKGMKLKITFGNSIPDLLNKINMIEKKVR